MSHLIMLAPANFGPSLAQLGKSRLTRVKSWFEKVEPGQGVLDWLELGSARAWDFNKQWITRSKNTAENGVFIFSLTGQTIDRKLYDHVNPYTGELGSDGVVRVPAANMNAGYIKLIQSSTETASIQDPATKEKEIFALNETIMVDIVLNRVVHEGVFEITKEDKPQDFRNQAPGKIIKG